VRQNISANAQITAGHTPYLRPLRAQIYTLRPMILGFPTPHSRAVGRNASEHGGTEMATIDDVFNLLNAVNQTTRGRIEGEIKDIQAHVG
jgi:hypothetical protein